MSLRSKNTNTPPLAEPAAEQPGTVLQLRNPGQLRKEWDAEAGKSEASAASDRETAARLKAEAEGHKRAAGEAADEEMRLMEALDVSRQRREQQTAQAEAKLVEVKSVENRAQFHEDRAADLRASIAALPAQDPAPHVLPNGVDPAGPTSIDLADRRLDGPMNRFNEAHDEHAAETGEQAVAS